MNDVIIVGRTYVSVPVDEDAQHAFEIWFASKSEELAEVMAPFGLHPDESIAMPTLERFLREEDIVRFER